MKRNFLYFFAFVCCVSCSDVSNLETKHDGTLKIVLDGEIQQEFVTRANDSGFADGDVSGVYIVDYNGTTPGTLTSDGNRADNVRMTFNATNYKWNMAYDVYFRDESTNVDIYGYYPFVSTISDVNNVEYSVSNDQSKEGSSSQLSGYEVSDFLWGKAENISPTANVIHVKYTHCMSSVKVTLLEGDGFDPEEWISLKKNVLMKNVKTNSIINLSTGEVTATGEDDEKGVIPYDYNDYYRAIVIPQSVAGGTVLFVVNVGNTSYKFSKSEAMDYMPGKMHNFTFKVDKKGLSGDYEFKLLSESIQVWENDDVAHDATLKEYVIINNETAGKLDSAIGKAGKSLDNIRNIKITGQINSRDFAIMRFGMPKLQALNLKEVKIVAGYGGDYAGNGYSENKEDEIPNGAMSGKETLTSLILPDKLKAIRGESGGGVGRGAFSYCSNLTGSLIIPEGVEVIEHAAFHSCSNLSGTLSLPSTLVQLGSESGYIDYWDGAFYGCGFVCELKLPESLRVIGMGSFGGCSGLYGELKLPDGLTNLGAGAFCGCSNLTGSLTIPQGVSLIPDNCFSYTGLNGNLVFHDGITAIGQSAFQCTPLKGALELPDNLRTLSHYAFCGCDFSGELKLPTHLEQIGSYVFGHPQYGANWRLMGKLEIPQNVISIGEGAFYNCRSIEGLVLPEGLENIRNAAFYGCYGIGSIVSKSAIPPHILGNAFEGVSKDNFTLEVPESAVAAYKTDASWKEFKRIAAHHELVCRPSVANAINTECTRTLVLNAEGDWYVDSKPDWVTLSQMSGTNKTELNLTFDQMAAGTETREANIVFKLKDKDYKTTCHVSQYDYKYGEDDIITLQKATSGNNGGINLVFLGDGYDAEDISDGTYLANIKEEVEDFFAIEPYTTYRGYFNVFTAIPVSTESGVGTVNTIRYNKFSTTYTGGVGLRADYDAITQYVLRIPQVTVDNINQATIIVVPNSTDYGGICYMWSAGMSIAFCPRSDYGYPLDTRGVVQHEAGGHGFGKLGDEYIYHNEFIDMCGCSCCPHDVELSAGKSQGWYDNLSLTGKMHEVNWSHLIFDNRYSDIVDIYEGGYMHNRGVFRSEQNSCMNNDIPYYSTISRESIVRRIKKYAGETFSFEDFVAKDSREPGNSSQSETRTPLGISSSTMQTMHSAPIIMKDSPIKNRNKK